MAHAMMTRPELKAIRIDPAQDKASYAFLGVDDDPDLKAEIESILARHPIEADLAPDPSSLPAGIRFISLPNAGILLEKDSCPTAPKFWHWKDIPRIRIKARQSTPPPGEHAHELNWKPRLLSAVLCGGLALTAFLIAHSNTESPLALGTLLYLAAYACGAWYPAIEVWELLRKRILDIHFLMLAVGVGAASIGHWAEGAVLLFLFALSGAMEALAMARTEREIQGLFTQAPKEAVRLDEDGCEHAVDVDAIATGMQLRVRPGEQFPVDATIISGSSSADESSLTGESVPVDKSPGDPVFSGTLNTWGMIDCQAVRAANESSLARIITLIREAQDSKAPSQRFTDQFGTGYTYAVLTASSLMFCVWHFGLGVPAFVTAPEESSAFYRAMTLLVVASPCALVLSIPSAILAGIAAGARGGVLFRGGIAIEKLADVQHIAMDKTGTLTAGELDVVQIESFPPGNEKRVLEMAACLAHQSTHPLSRSILQHWRALHPDSGLPEAAHFRSVNGMGITGTLQHSPIQLGRREMFSEWDALPPLPEIGVTECLVGNAQIHGRILLRDHVRSESAPLLQQLYRLGLKVTMLTGDRQASAQKVAQEIHLDDFKAELQPEDKVAAIRHWRQQGQQVAMIGDGLNDAPSLAAADVAVGMGLRGSDAVLEQADIVLMHDRLENFHYAYTLSRKAKRIIRQNLVISLGVIIILVIGALSSTLPLTLGVIGHEGSTVVVVLNSLRLLFHQKQQGQS